MIQSYGMSIGLKLLLRRRLKFAYGYLVQPVHYWRELEYRLAVQESGFQAGQKVLDIGSPKLLSLYLADKLGLTVYANYFVGEFRYLRDIQGISPEAYVVEDQDGRKLSYPDETFDRVISLSVFEHIPDDGDTHCIREVCRTLKPGGRVVITTPFHRDGVVEYNNGDFYYSGSSVKTDDGSVFFQRRYSEEQLRSRIIEPSGMNLVKLEFIGEKVMTNSKKELCNYLPDISGPIQPTLSRIFLTKPSPDWRNLKKPLAALIVLEKP